jgi:hypothetical protein
VVVWSGLASCRAELLRDRVARPARFDAGNANSLEPASLPRDELDLGLANAEQIGNKLETLGIGAAADGRSGDSNGERVAVTSRDR